MNQIGKIAAIAVTSGCPTQCVGIGGYELLNRQNSFDSVSNSFARPITPGIQNPDNLQNDG